MGIYKQYLYKSMYIQTLIEDMVKAGYIKEELTAIDVSDDEKLLVTVTSEGKNENMFVLISRNDNKESLLGYQDKGETIRYMKLIGRLNTAAYIASCIKKDDRFYIMDKSKQKYGISKINVLGNDYIVVGGYENPTWFFNINGMHPKKVTDLVLRKLIDADHEFCTFNAKSLNIYLDNSVAAMLGSDIFVKPYIIQ